MYIKEEYLEELAFLEMEEIKRFIDCRLKYCNIPYELDYRVKSLEKMKLKQQLLPDIKSLLDIHDIIGFRIALDTENDVCAVLGKIISTFNCVGVIDYFSEPRDTGYKAFNCYFNLWAFNVEIQIMTKEMRDWINKTHDEYNKKKYGDILIRVK